MTRSLNIARLLVCALLIGLPAHAASDANLLRLPKGARCTDDRSASNTAPGWIAAAGSPALFCAADVVVNAESDRPVPSSIVSSGPYGPSVLKRDVDVSAAASAIDAGSTTFVLAGAFGDTGKPPAHAILSATFRDEAGALTGGRARIDAPVNISKRSHIVLTRRFARGQVPVGTRSIRVVLQFVGAKPGQSAAYAGDLRLTLTPELELPPPPPPKSTVPAFDHVFIIMMENTDYAQVIGDTKDAPFINTLAGQGTLLTNYQAVYHPSDENYLAIAGGDTFVRGAIYFPRIHVPDPHIGDLIETAGKTWKAYEQGMGMPCNTDDSYDKYYEPDDAPFINFNDVRKNRERCRTHLFDTAQMSADLKSAAATPNFAWIAADDYYDGEAAGNGSPHSLRIQDRWLKRTLEPVFASPAWRNERSLLILTWDESRAYRTNHVATILFGSQGLTRAGHVSNVRYDHYSVGRTIEAALGLPPLTSNDAYARPINDAFARSTPAR